jgi:hypothetical protein
VRSAKLSFSDSVVVDCPAEVLYDMVSDVTRVGEWSPICKACWWDAGVEAPRVGAWFTGRNELPERTWETRSRVVVAEPGREFTWEVGDSFVRWGYALDPLGPERTRLTEHWTFLPAGIASFHERFGADAEIEIADRAEKARTGIPDTLAAIKRIAERGANPSRHRARR